MEQISVFYGFNGLIYVVESDLCDRSCGSNASGSSGNRNQSRVLQLRQDLPDDHRVGIDTGSKKVARNLAVIFESLHAGEDVQGYGKSA